MKETNDEHQVSTTAREDLEDAYDVSRRAIRAWGKENERWMVVEESGEFLDTFAKLRRGRATEDDLVDEGADRILTTINAMACEDIPPSRLYRALVHKLGRTKRPIAKANTMENPPGGHRP